MKKHLFLASFPKLAAKPPAGLDSEAEQDDINIKSPNDFMNIQMQPREANLKHVELDNDSGSIFYQKDCAYVHHMSRDGIHCVFAGEVSCWPGHSDLVAEAHNAFVRGDTVGSEDNESDWLLSFYAATQDSDTSFDKIADTTLGALSSVQGGFAFILYDSITHTLWAARDQQGEQELWWGVTPDGVFMLATHEAALEGLCLPSATMFPPGCLFASHGAQSLYEPGSWGFVLPQTEALVGPESLLLSFIPVRETKGQGWRGVKAVPRMNEKGVLCGAVYKVASEMQLDQMGAARAH